MTKPHPLALTWKDNADDLDRRAEIIELRAEPRLWVNSIVGTLSEIDAENMRADARLLRGCAAQLLAWKQGRKPQ
jgi:hypothetical protein